MHGDVSKLNRTAFINIDTINYMLFRFSVHESMSSTSKKEMCKGFWFFWIYLVVRLLYRGQGTKLSGYSVRIQIRRPWVRSLDGVGWGTVFLCLRVNSCADLFFAWPPPPPLRVYGTRPNVCAHVKDPTSVRRKRVIIIVIIIIIKCIYIAPAHTSTCLL